jgi:hypothetical protein
MHWPLSGCSLPSFLPLSSYRKSTGASHTTREEEKIWLARNSTTVQIRQGRLAMRRIIIAAATFGVVAATAGIVTWSRFADVEPVAATYLIKAEAALATRAPMISPLEIMATHGKDLPVEAWDAF